MKEEIQNILVQYINRWRQSHPSFEVDGVPVAVDTAPANVPGDLALSYPLAAAKKLRRPPREVAQELLRQWSPHAMVDKVEVAGPGFLNFTLSGEWLKAELERLLSSPDTYGQKPTGSRGRVLVEFVSANPTGPLHVGHGRGAALGDSLARLLRFAGHAVDTEYYVNNVGNQMDNLGATLMSRAAGLSPDALSEEEKTILRGRNIDDFYKGDYMKDIAQVFVREHPAPAGRPQGLRFFTQRAVASILAGIQKDLADFRVDFTRWFSENTLYDTGAVDKALAELRQGGHLKEGGGALWFLSTNFGDDKDRVLKRQNERPTYFASDIAYHRAKFERGYDRMVDIWGTDHHGYVRRVKAAVTALGYDPEKLTILLYQLVGLVRNGVPVAMSTRSGEFVTLREVIDEVGSDACRFFFALRGPNSQLEFDLELAKKQAPENPVFYVQYVHARCRSLFREAEKRGALPLDFKRSAAWPGRFEEPERILLLKLACYPDIIEQCTRELSPHALTAYLLGLAGDYHRFYEKCRVVGEPGPAGAFRLALVSAVGAVIRSGLGLLGVNAPDSM